MMRLLTQILAAGGLLLAMAGILVLRVLSAPLAGLIVVIYVVLVLFQMLGDKEYRKNLFASESDRRKLLDGNG
jgi:uncharacterized membrane protein YfcA